MYLSRDRDMFRQEQRERQQQQEWHASKVGRAPQYLNVHNVYNGDIFAADV